MKESIWPLLAEMPGVLINKALEDKFSNRAIGLGRSIICVYESESLPDEKKG